MSSLINFNFQSQPVRTITDEHGEVWFVASDVCNILGYANSRRTIDLHCKTKGVTKRYTPTESGNQEMVYINEPNLYRLIIKSKKPEAEKFEEWVMEEVLPSIRKTGSYGEPKAQTRITPQTLTELAPITPFKSHLSASDFKEHTTEGEKLVQVLHPLIEQLADCYYDKSVAYEQIKKTIAHYCGIKNFHWITLERIPTALTVLSIMKNEATAHKKMMHRLDDNARLALSYKTVNAIGYTGETFDSVEV